MRAVVSEVFSWPSYGANAIALLRTTAARRWCGPSTDTQPRPVFGPQFAPYRPSPMMSIRPLPAIAGLLLLCAVLPACAQTTPSSTTTNPPAAEAPATEASPPEESDNTGWATILGEISAPDNWQVTPCENPALLCVRADGDTLGTVERFSYPLSEVNLQGGAPQTPDAQRQFLDAWVADHQATIQQDRAAAAPNLRFTSDLPAPVAVGRLTGLRYGYALSDSEGVVRERTVGYVATDGEQVYVFVTGVITGDPTGPFGRESDLSAFEPHLATIIEGLRL